MHWRTIVARLITAALLASAAGTPAGADELLEFPAIADADVDASAPASNFGSASRLRVDGAPERVAHLRFVVAGVGDRPVGQARLRLEVASASAKTGGTLYAITDHGWEEPTITWATRPAVDGPPLGSLGPVASGEVVEFALESVVGGDGIYDFAITSAFADGMTYHSSESTRGRPPALSLVVGGPSRPRIAIVQPPASTTFFAGRPITLAGAATDDLGSDLGPGIAWSSSLDGPLGTGATLVLPALSLGVHEISATVADASGEAAAASVTITVVPRELVFTAIADTVVDATRPTSPLGSATSLKVNYSPVADALFRFQLAGLPVAIKQAALILTAASSSGAASDAGGQVHAISDHGWTEEATTFATRPAIDGPALAAAGDVRAKATVALDVTAAIAGDGVYDFAVVGRSTDSVTYRSREASSGRPRLVIRPAAAGDDPMVRIDAPARGASVSFGEPILLSAVASDPQNGDLSSRVVWTSDVDGALGVGPGCRRVLNPGTHVLTATVTDDDLDQVAATTTLRVNVGEAGIEDFGYDRTIERGSDPITGQKPESKLWYHDGSWWATLFAPAAGAYHVHELDVATQTWIDTGVRVDERGASRQDVLAEGDALWVASRHNRTPRQNRLLRYTYLPGARTYALDAGFPVSISGAGAETLTIARDSFGTLWTAYARNGQVFVNRTLGSDTQWGSNFVVPVVEGTTVHTDDIAAVVALPGKIGVFWNSHLTDRFYLALHTDGLGATDPAAWTLEVAATGANVADDHLNLKVASDGRLFVAVKTDRLGPDATALGLLVRSPTGEWSRLHKVATPTFEVTRPQCLIDESSRRVYVFYSAHDAAIHYKSSSLDAIAFPGGVGTPLIVAQGMNNPTTTKQTVDAGTGAVILASTPATARYWHATLPLTPAEPAADRCDAAE